jgi:hypothetical protein
VDRVAERRFAGDAIVVDMSANKPQNVGFTERCDELTFIVLELVNGMWPLSWWPAVVVEVVSVDAFSSALTPTRLKELKEAAEKLKRHTKVRLSQSQVFEGCVGE